MPSAAALWCPIASPVVSRPKTRKGCARAWYATSFAMGSGMKYLTCANTCGAREAAKSPKCSLNQICLGHAWRGPPQPCALHEYAERAALCQGSLYHVRSCPALLAHSTRRTGGQVQGPDAQACHTSASKPCSALQVHKHSKHVQCPVRHCTKKIPEIGPYGSFRGAPAAG